jgi:molybdopterin-guanine dinucleotide biosynthesis protein A
MVLQDQATAIIIAGGDSNRMGADKGMLLIQGQPMIKCIYDQLHPHFNQILNRFLGAEVVPVRLI